MVIAHEMEKSMKSQDHQFRLETTATLPVGCLH